MWRRSWGVCLGLTEGTEGEADGIDPVWGGAGGAIVGIVCRDIWLKEQWVLWHAAGCGAVVSVF
jgi:hypothetical protein